MNSWLRLLEQNNFDYEVKYDLESRIFYFKNNVIVVKWEYKNGGFISLNNKIKIPCDNNKQLIENLKKYLN